MPDSFEHTPTLAVRMPNGALASLAGNVDAHHHVAIADLDPRAVLGAGDRRRGLMHEPAAGPRRPVGDDVPAQHRAPDHLARQVDQPRRARRRRRLRSVARARGVDASRARRRLHRARRRRPHLPRAACARSRTSGRSPASTDSGSGRPRACSETCRARSRRWSAARSSRRAARAGSSPATPYMGAPDRRHRDIARLHVRLQLLLDHRDARPQLPSPADRACDRRHPRRARSRRPRDLHRRRQHHHRRAALRSAVPRHRRRRPRRHPLSGAGDDRLDRAARRDAGAADAAGRDSAMCSSASRTSSRTTSRSCKATAKNSPPRHRRGAPEHDDGGDRRAASARHVHRRRAHRRQPRRHARGDRREPDVREEVRRLAVHPAPDAVSGHADDEGLPRPRPDRQHARRRVRRHDRR